MRFIILFLLVLLAPFTALGISAQEIPKVDPAVPSIIITPWVRDGNLKRWEAFVADGTHTTPIVVSEDKEGNVNFHMKRKCFEREKAVPETLLAWRGGREMGLELRCDGKETASKMPRLIEDVAMKAPGFPPELREKIQNERTLLGKESPQKKRGETPAPQKREPSAPPANVHPPREFTPLELPEGYRRI